MKNDFQITSETFSQPFGRAQLYHEPPYLYRNAHSINMAYTVEREGLDKLLPPGVELADADPFISAVVSAYPETPFGVYNEMWFYVRVKFGGKTFMFNPVIYVDSDSSMACGREVWGFPKKIARMSMRNEGNVWFFHGERNTGERLIDVKFTVGKPAVPKLLSEISHPSLTMRLIPNRLGRGEPDIAQLISVSNPKTILKGDGGVEKRWLGEAELDLGTGSDLNPVHLFKPKKMLGAWMSYYNADLPEGELVHDYKTGG